MDIKDLRIGSVITLLNSGELIVPTGMLFKIASLSRSEIKVHRAEFYQVEPNDIHVVSLSDLSPVRLNEEWLIRFGFEKGKPPRTFIRSILGVKELPIIISCVIPEDSTRCAVIVGNEILCYVEYVHELQNLLYAITFYDELHDMTEV